MPKRQKKPQDMRAMWRILGVVAVMMVLFMWATSSAASRAMAPWERDLFYAIYNWPTFLTPLFLVITQLGSTWALTIFVLLAAYFGKKRLALYTVLVGALVYSVVYVGKELIARPRPEDMFTDVSAREPFVNGFSYPSAHAAMAMVIGLSLFPYVSKKYRWIVVLGVGLVGVSRIYLGVHFPLDVLAGFLIGGMIGALLYLPHHRKVGKPKWLYRKVDF